MNNSENKKNSFVIVLLLIIIIVLLVMLLLSGNKLSISLGRDSSTNDANVSEASESNIDIEGEGWNGSVNLNGVDENSMMDDSIVYFCYSDIYLNEKNKALPLVNDASNNVYVRYTVYNGSKIIYTTKYIKPGNIVYADIYDSVDEGETVLDIIVEAIDIDTSEECTGASYSVKVIK